MDILEGSEANLHGWANYTYTESVQEDLDERSHPSSLTFETYRLIEAGLGHLAELLMPQSQSWGLLSRNLRKWRRLTNTLLNGLTFWVVDRQPDRSPGYQRNANGSKSLDDSADAKESTPSSDSLLQQHSGNFCDGKTALQEPPCTRFVVEIAGKRTEGALPSDAGAHGLVILRPEKVDIYPQFQKNCARRARAYHDLLWETGALDFCSKEHNSAIQSLLGSVSANRVSSHSDKVIKRSHCPEYSQLCISSISDPQAREICSEDAREELMNDDLETESEARVLLANMLSAQGWQFRPVQLSKSFVGNCDESYKQNTVSKSDNKIKVRTKLARAQPQPLEDSPVDPSRGVTRPRRPNAPGVNGRPAPRYRPDYLLMIKENRRLVSHWLRDAQQELDS